MNALVAHSWPGNVRELEHAVERAVVLAETTSVGLGDLNLRRPVAEAAAIFERMTLSDAEGHLIRKALERTGSVMGAAEALGALS